MAAKKGLGKGLDTLFSDSGYDLDNESLFENTDAVTTVRISDIEPDKNQPRKLFYDDSLEELAESIRLHGILQPLALRRMPGERFQIIAGERRFRAAKRAGLDTVPAVIVEADDKETAELALIENLQREDLKPLEEAQGYQALMEEFETGTTLMNGRGGYSNDEKTVIYFVVNRFQIARMRNIVQALDPKAFMTITEVADVFKAND